MTAKFKYMITTIKFTRLTNFTGRNGCFKASGIELFGYGPKGNVLLTPLTSKGIAARCNVTIPLEDIPILIKELKKIHNLKTKKLCQTGVITR